jgi:hypothetical protein
MIHLVWLVAVMTSGGPVFLDVHEDKPFASMKACEDFSREYRQRIEDYMRGRLRLEWSRSVDAAGRCIVPGQDL